MDLTYKILWFENELDYVDGFLDELSAYVENLGFKFIKPRVEADNTHVDEIKYQDYDLILMDYKLSNEEKGDSIIEKIRGLNVYTEIIFYSSSGVGALRASVQQNGIDGVYCVDRGEAFLPRVEDVIKSTVKKVLDANTVRGIVMAQTSDFDKMMIDIISTYLGKIDEASSNQFLERRKKKFLISHDEKIKKFEGSKEYYKEWIFDSSHKWRAVIDIVKRNIPALKDITSLFDPEIIKIRDDLAHVVEIDDPNGSGQKCLANGDLIFNEERCQKILNDLKKHEENFNLILKTIISEKEK
jgi:hypothetical protein